MGNVVPCLVVQSSSATATTTMPAMESGKRMYSLKIVMKVLLYRMKKIRRSNIAGRSPSVPARGGGGEVKRSIKLAGFAKPSPRRAAACHGRHGGGVGGGHCRKGVVTMKVVLTKEEAARLLSLTSGGKKATAAQIVAEMRRMEARRAAAASSTAWRPALASIPEESW